MILEALYLVTHSTKSREHEHGNQTLTFSEKKRTSHRIVLGNLNSSNNSHQDCKIEPQLDGLEDVPTRSRKRTESSDAVKVDFVDVEELPTAKGFAKNLPLTNFFRKVNIFLINRIFESGTNRRSKSQSTCLKGNDLLASIAITKMKESAFSK